MSHPRDQEPAAGSAQYPGNGQQECMIRLVNIGIRTIKNDRIADGQQQQGECNQQQDRIGVILPDL
jgi:hypothetical protein